MINRLITFGDSFTEGEGAWLEKTNSIEKDYESNPSEGRRLISEFNFQYSWPTQLAKNLKIEASYKIESRTASTKFLNAGSCGASNDYIFNEIFKQDAIMHYKEGDLVVVMWSSSIRNKLPFFPSVFQEHSPIGLGWSLKEVFTDSNQNLESNLHNFTKRYYKDPNDVHYIENTLKPFMAEYFKPFITEVYDDQYYNLINYSYIHFLQSFFKYKGCDYIFIDGFESMNSFDPKSIKWSLIDKSKYWNFGKLTAWDHLSNIGGDVFENIELSFSPPGQKCHPNRHGYKLIADTLYNHYHKFVAEQLEIDFGL